MVNLPIVRLKPPGEAGELAPFAGMPPERIVMPDSAAKCEAALRELLAWPGPIGFDTESKPTFRVGEHSDGPDPVRYPAARLPAAGRHC